MVGAVLAGVGDDSVRAAGEVFGYLGSMAGGRSAARRSSVTPDGTVDAAQAATSVHPSAQYVPHAGQTHTRWRRSIVHTHDTDRSEGRPGPSIVHR